MRQGDVRAARNASLLRILASLTLIGGLFAFDGLQRLAYLLFFFVLFVLWERHA